MLDLGKALSFLLSILSLCSAAMSAFFVPGLGWQERLLLALPKLVVAACVCFASGLLFSWPSPTNPEADQALLSTLPVRLFFWGFAGIVILFVTSSYLVAGAPCIPSASRFCG